MINQEIFYPLILFLFFEIYTLLGGWILSLNPKNNLNRTFFVLCLSLGIWVLSFSLSAASANFSGAQNWRRVAAFGWGTLYSILLHYFLILTERKELLKKKWMYAAIYGPAIVNILVFGLIGSIARQEFHLEHTDFGWVSIPRFSFWDTFFNIYYISFSIAILIILIDWGFRKNRDRKKQAIELILTIIIPVILGTFSDIIANRFTNIEIPSLAPFLIAIPLGGIYHGIRKYGLMLPKEENETTQLGLILNETEQINFFRYIGIAFIVASLMNLSFYFIGLETFHAIATFSAGLYLSGFALFILPSFPLKEFNRNNIMIGIVNIALVLLIYRFSIVYTDHFIWPVSLIFLIAAIIFNKRYFLISISGTAILTQIWVLIRRPEAIVNITAMDYFIRLGFLISGTLLALYAHKIYIKRLKENESQLELQRMISQISSRLVSVTESNMDEIFSLILEDLDSYYQTDHIWIATISRDENSITNIYKKHQKIVNSEDKVQRDQPNQNFPWFMNQIHSHNIFYIPDIKKLPPEAEAIKNVFIKKSINSLTAVPIKSKGKLLGLIGLGYTEASKLLHDDYKKMLTIPANLVADALTKIDSEKKINFMAYYDSLTRLPNRTLFQNRLEIAIPLAKRTKKKVAVLMLDLDSFKTINDTMGHDSGDILLQQVTKRLSSRIREYDTLSRFGGDEFLFILSQLKHQKDVEIIVEKLKKSLETPILINDEEIYVTVSIGIALFPQDGSNSETLIKCADIAMYESKRLGKNRYTFFSPEMEEDTHEKMQLTNDLFRALENNEFFLDYQPQIKLNQKDITGLEALIRWNHPTRGVIPPAVFIPIAEETTLISSIGEWVLRTACTQNKKLQEQGLAPMRMAVNLSVQQFYSQDLVGTVTEILSDTGLQPEYLELEITESIALTESDSISETLHQLKEIGVSISIDDFGTEYSSLSRLKQIPFDRIKIDQQFIHGISISKNDESITSFILDLARSMDIEVIAEGVENSLQLSFLSEKSCDEIQGFYFYKPMPITEIEDILKKQ